MPTATIAGVTLDLNDEGFLTTPSQWTEEVGAELAKLIGVPMTDAHWKMIRFLRSDFDKQGETATLRRASKETGVPVKELFALFPAKPAKKMAYVAGLPKPKGCV